MNEQPTYEPQKTGGNVAACYRIEQPGPLMEGPAFVFQVLDESMSPRYPKGCYLWCSPVMEFDQVRPGEAFLLLINENRFRQVVAVGEQALTLRVCQPAELEAEEVARGAVEAIYAVEWIFIKES